MGPSYLTEKQLFKLDCWKKWGERMSLLRNIHKEIEPKLDKLKKEREIMNSTNSQYGIWDNYSN